jgi:hypothetical protein
MTLNATPADPAADSYFTLAEATTYFGNRGVTTWNGTTQALEVAARLGTQYLDNAYRLRWKGITAARYQSLAWPRVDGSRGARPYYGASYQLFDENGWPIDPTTVPNQVKYAAMEAALIALSGGTLEPTLVRGGRIKSQTKTVGPLSKSTVWADGAPATDRYLVIENFLSGLTNSSPGSSAGNVSIVRA